MARDRVVIPVDGDLSPLERELEKLRKKGVSLDLDRKNFSKPLGQIKGDLGEFDKSLKASNARVLAFGASAGAIYAVSRALRETVTAAIQVEKSLAEINVVLNTSQRNINKFGKDLFRIAAQTGQSFFSAAEAATEFSRQGLGMEKTLQRTKDALVLARLSGLDMAASVNTITAALNGFSSAAINSTLLVSKLAAVDAAFAVSTKDLAEALRRVGSTAESAGVSLDELLGVVTAAQQITARGGAVIGNSFKTIFTRLQRPRTLEALEQIGVATKNASGQQLSAIRILENLAQVYDTLADAQKAQIAELVGGVFQINVLKATLKDLSGSYSVYKNAAEIATNAANEGTLKNEQLNKTLSAALNETAQNLTAIGAAVGKLSLEPAIKNVLGIVNKITGAFVSAEDETEKFGEKAAKGILRGIGKFLAGPGLIIAFVGLFKLFKNLGKFAADAFTTLTGLNSSLKTQQQTQQALVNILQQNPALLKQIERGEITIHQAAQAVHAVFKAQTAELEKQQIIAARMAATLGGSGARIGGAPPRGRASGYIPNFANRGFQQEESMARMLGASRNVRAQRSKGTIGGRRFIMNNQEMEIVGYGRNGDSAVIPMYGQGYVPNFVRQPRITVGGAKKDPAATINAINNATTLSALQNIRPTSKVSPAVLAAVQKRRKELEKTGGVASGLANITKTGLIITGRSVGSGFLDTSPQALGITNRDILSKFNKVRVSGIKQFTPKALGGQLADVDGDAFDKMIERPINDAMVKISKQFIGSNRKLPKATEILKTIQSDKTGYPQMAGRIFETAINMALGISHGAGGRRWDLNKSAIQREGRGALWKEIFGTQAKSIVGFNQLDIKRSGLGSKSTRTSVAGKISSRAGLRKTIENQLLRQTKGKAAGFIPNFAVPGLADAIQREHNANTSYSAMRVGQNRAFVNSQNPGGHFVSNTRDEPRGIRDILARGYVPNFVSGAGVMATNFNTAGNREMAQNTAAVAQQASSQKHAEATAKSTAAMNKLFAATTLATLATSIFAGNTENASPAMKNVAAGANAVGQGFMAATGIMAAFPGPWGIAIGAAVGLGVAIYSFIKNMDKSDAKLNSLAEQLEKNKAKFQEQLDSVSSTQQAYSSLEEAIKAGDAKKLAQAQNQVSIALSKLPGHYRSMITSGGSLVKSQEALAKIQFQLAKQQALNLALSKRAEERKAKIEEEGKLKPDLIIDKFDLSFNQQRAVGTTRGSEENFRDFLAQYDAVMRSGDKEAISFMKAQLAATGLTTAELKQLRQILELQDQEAARSTSFVRDAETGAIDKKALAGLTKDIFSGLDSDKILKEFALNPTILFGAAQKGSEEFKAALEKLGISSAQAEQILEGLGKDVVGMKKLAAEIDNMGRAAVKTQEQLKTNQALIDAQAAAQQAANEAAAQAAKQLGLMTDAMTIMSQGIAKARQETQKAGRDMLLNTLKAGAKLAAQFQTEESQASQQGAIRNLEINEKANDAAQKVNEKSREQAFKAFEKLPGVQKALERIQSGTGSKEDLQLQTALGAAKSATAGQGFDATLAALNTLVTTFSGQKKPLGENVNLTGQLVKLGLENNLALAAAERTRQQQLAENKLQVRVARMQAQINRDVAAGGGIKAFLDPKIADEMENGFNKSIKNFTLASKKGDTVQQGRAAASLVGNLQEFLGGPQTGAGFEGLKDVAVKGLAKSFRSRALSRASELERAGRETGNQDLIQAAKALRARAQDAERIAETQVAKEYKREQMPQNIENLLQSSKQLEAIQKMSQQANLNTANNTWGILQALSGGALTGVAQGLGGALAAPGTVGAGGIGAAMITAGGVVGPQMTTATAGADRARAFEEARKKREEGAGQVQALIGGKKPGELTKEELKNLQKILNEMHKADKEMLANLTPEMIAAANKKLDPTGKTGVNIVDILQERIARGGKRTGSSRFSDAEKEGLSGQFGAGIQHIAQASEFLRSTNTFISGSVDAFGNAMVNAANDFGQQAAQVFQQIMQGYQNAQQQQQQNNPNAQNQEAQDLQNQIQNAVSPDSLIQASANALNIVLGFQPNAENVLSASVENSTVAAASPQEPQHTTNGQMQTIILPNPARR